LIKKALQSTPTTDIFDLQHYQAYSTLG